MSARRSQRNRLYLVGVLPSLLLLLVSARLLMVAVDQDAGVAAYAAGEHASAQERFARNGLLNPLEPWIAPFNEGDALFRLADYRGAVASFTAALSEAPAERECDVANNLALSHEALGDRASRRGELAAALASWQRGRDALERCLSPEAPGSEETRATSRVIEARLEDKIGPQVEVEADVPVPSDDETKAKIDAVEQRNQLARERRERRTEQQAPGGGGAGAGGSGDGADLPPAW
jgi:tetratricopeptide (TPR) repeat protein